jgi:putative ABC transport system ATP-binding protein
MNPSTPFFIPPEIGHERIAPIHETSALAVDVSDLQFGWDTPADPILDIMALQLAREERVLFEGPSGSRKSTLLSVLAGVMTSQKGAVSLLGQRVDALSGAQRDRFRADHVGFIFQMFNLVPYLSLIENLTLPCRFSKRRRKRSLRRSASVGAEAVVLLTHLNMADPHLLKRPATELSVGQQQRVAAARALIGAPEISIADEPTSSLDAHQREAFICLLFDECAKESTNLVFVSHDNSPATMFDRTVSLTQINHARRHRRKIVKEAMSCRISSWP